MTWWNVPFHGATNEAAEMIDLICNICIQPAVRRTWQLSFAHLDEVVDDDNFVAPSMPLTKELLLEITSNRVNTAADHAKWGNNIVKVCEAERQDGRRCTQFATSIYKMTALCTRHSTLNARRNLLIHKGGNRIVRLQAAVTYLFDGELP